MSLQTVNPFYAARFKRALLKPQAEPYQPVYAKLPRAPKNGSPVPHLTSLYHSSRAGEYGDRGYPGNCGGNLIKDLLKYFKPFSVFDPMTGSGACRDVCEELGIYCWSEDIHGGFDVCDPSHVHGDAKLLSRRTFDFCWLHPPYWRQKIYCVAQIVMWRWEERPHQIQLLLGLLRHITVATNLSGTPSGPCRRGSVGVSRLSVRRLLGNSPRLSLSSADPLRRRCSSSPTRRAPTSRESC